MRIRPAVGDAAFKRVSKDSLAVGDRKYTFDAVFESNSTQVWNLLQNIKIISTGLIQKHKHRN